MSAWLFNLIGDLSQTIEVSFQIFSNLFLKIFTEGAVTTEVGSLFQYFTTITEKAGGGSCEWEGEKTIIDQHPRDP